MQRLHLLVPLGAAAICLTGCDFALGDLGGGSERFTQDFHYSYTLKPGGRVNVENFNGSVEISGWDENQVEVTGTKYAPTPELRDAIKIDIQPSSDSVYIRTVRPSERRGNMGAKYVIRVPRRVQLERIVTTNGSLRASELEGAARLKTTNGAVRIADLRGNVDAQTTNGTIEIQSLDGGATLRTTNGRIHAEDVKGDVEAETSNGGIHVQLDPEAESGKSVRLGTSNGSVELVLRHPTRNDVHVSTTNGSITVRLPQGMGANLKANTSHSSITSEFDVRATGENSKHHLEGAIGSGGPTLDLSTSNGSIRVLKL